MPYLQNAGAFLVTSLFGFAICVFLLRTLLIAIGAPFNQPICRFVYLLTNPVIMPLRNVMPRWRRVEFASLLVAWALCALELLLLVALFGAAASAAALLVRALVDTLDWLILIELVAILAYCVLSFVPSLRYDDNFRLLARLTEPVARPFRRLVPPLGGLDFSCWFASLALVLARLLLIAPLADWAARLG
jgi:YggT family protein